MKKVTLSILLLSALAIAGPVEDMFENDFRFLPDNKAMAIAVNEETGAWAAGHSENMPSLSSAKNVALKNCKHFAKKFKVQRRCKIYAINNDVIASTY